MPSALTGDYHAVVQVSGPTVNRLVAGLHQNGFSDADRPSIPHSVSLRIGDPTALRGHRGWVQAQIGVPRVSLVQRSSDRFHLELGVRARYRADAGSRPLPEFINGTIRAEFRVVDIDPNCFGWREKAADHVWVRVVRGSVTFEGSASDDRGWAAVEVFDDSDPAEINARIAGLIEILLMTRFEANPHRVGRDFRRSWMRSLVDGRESGVAVPVGLSGPPNGSLTSLDRLFLGGRDVAAAITTDWIIGHLNVALQEQVGFLTTLRFRHRTEILGWDAVSIDIGWNVSLTSAWVSWSTGLIVSLVGGPATVMTLHLTGKADTSKNQYDLDISATVSLSMHFDAASQELVVQPVGSAAVNVDAHIGWPLEGLVESYAADYLKPLVTNLVPTRRISVAPMTTRLAEQLGKLDAGAGARFDSAEFGFDEVVLRGDVWVSGRRPPLVKFVKTPEGDGFSGLEAWIPGGRIDRFEWSWVFLDGETGAAKRDDRWLLRRPRRPQQGKFGLSTGGRSPLPGLDGSGRICLTIRGARVDPVSGALVPVSTSMTCNRYGLWWATTIDQGLGRPDLRDVPELSQDVPFPELAVRHALLPAGAAAANTLVVLVGSDRLDGETAAALLGGLAEARRRDAGLSVVVLLADGSLSTDSARSILADLGPSMRKLGAAVTVNEDVDGASARALGACGEGGLSWRLLSPRGGVTWSYDGALEAATLAWALDECLLPSSPPMIAEVDPWLSAISAEAIWGAAFGDLVDLRSKCPPVSLRDSVAVGLDVVFVRAGSHASDVALREFAAAHHDDVSDGRSPWAMAVVDGADQAAAEALGSRLGLDVPMLGDPDGQIASRLGVRIWPTAVRTGGARSERVIVSEPAPRPEPSARTAE